MAVLSTPVADAFVHFDFKVAFVVALIAIVVYTFKQHNDFNKRKGGAKTLPGPKGAPIIGNLRQIPAVKPWVALKQWGDEFGPLYRLRLGVQEVVVVSSADHAIELLDRRSPKYSSRPRQVMANDLLSRGLRLTFMPYHDLWRKERKLIHKLTSAQASATYEPMQDLESTQLMIDMLERPKAFWGHCQRYAGSLIMQVAFNKRANRNTDPAVADMRALLEELTAAAVPGRHLVDSLPWLNYLPAALAPWKATGERIFKNQEKLFYGHMNDVKRDIAAGQDAHCFVKYMLDMQKESGLTDQEIAFLAGVMYGAGSDTTSDAIATFIMTMVNHPEQQRLAQEEIDRVVGRDRMPTFEDQTDLVYVSALVKEVQRWRPVIAGGLAHATTQDDVYEGYFIPAGTTIIPNAWAIHMDPKVYPEPEKFKPERFIKDNQVVGIPQSERGHFGFGYGRRICPGMYIAERSLYIVFARMLWGYNIAHAKDALGQNIPVDVNAYTTGFSSHPKKFLCSITPRHKDVETIVRAAAEHHHLPKTSGLAE
ncbi:putative O-methylsterigmatocystin oxidoreductase [Cystobasidium minutum MCA 4210]|uniref:putative O-methylsterigmatocystin oxidoreductase n=1 Tax=Cystobasidium minutum MCA 4210 TaxID=1397322 RepID=UPI0034CF7436|eukprot:jgi/Rhomi1/10022/CE10021_689